MIGFRSRRPAPLSLYLIACKTSPMAAVSTYVRCCSHVGLALAALWLSGSAVYAQLLPEMLPPPRTAEELPPLGANPSAPVFPGGHVLPGTAGTKPLPAELQPNATGELPAPPPIEGPRVQRVDPHGQTVVDVRVAGNTAIPTNRVASQIKTRPGRMFDASVVRDDIRALNRTRWFIFVESEFVQAPNGVVVVYRVVERSRLEYIKILGNTAARRKTLEKKAGLKVGDPLDPYSIERGKEAIAEFYREHGFNRVRVEVLEGSRRDDKGAVYLIDEGKKQTIEKVQFEGNTIATDARLRTQIQSKKPFLGIFGGHVDREKIDGDIERLTAYYRSLGFFQARVGVEPEFNEDLDELTLTFVIHEGMRYKVRNVSVVGVTKFRTEELNDEMKLRTEDYFDQPKMNADVDKLKEIYGAVGYIFADVQAEPRFLEEPGTIDLVYSIKEGDRYRVGRIDVQIKGDNPHTRVRTVLNRIDLRPGDIVDIRKLRDSERRLRASGLFRNEPHMGAAPRILVQPAEMETGEELLGQNGGAVRGQSPDGLGAHAVQKPAVVVISGELRPEDAVAVPPQPGMVSNAWSHQPAAGSMAMPQGVAPIATAPPAPSPQPLAPVAFPPGAAPIAVRPGLPWQRVPVAVPPAAPRMAAPGVPQQGVPMPQGHQPPGYAPQGYDTAGYQPNPSQPPAPVMVNGQPHPWPNAAAMQNAGFSGNAGGVQQAGGIQVNGAPAGNVSADGGVYDPRTMPAIPYNAAPTANSRQPSPWSRPTEAQPTPAPTTVRYQSPDAAPSGWSSPANNYGGGARYAETGAAQEYQPGSRNANPNPTRPPQTNLQASPRVAQGGGAIPPPPIQGNPGPSPLPSPPGGLAGDSDPLVPPGGYINLDEPDRDAILIPQVEETQTGRLSFGVGVNSEAGVLGNIVLDEQNFDITRVPTSWSQLGTGTAFRGAGQRLRLEAVPGNQVQRYMMTFREPYFLDSPVSFGVNAFYFDRLYDDWTEQRLGGNVSLGYQIRPDVSVGLTLRAEDVNISNIPFNSPQELQDVLGDNGLYSAKLSLTRDTRDSSFLPTEGHRIELAYEQNFGDFDFPRVTAEASQYFMLSQRPDGSGRHVLSVRGRFGITGSQTPVFENFFAGGFSTLRGFDFRGASPVQNGVVVGGELMALGSVEYMVPLTADDMLRGVVFCDFGTVESDVTFDSNNLRVAPGVGLRITIPAMGPAPIALDFAYPMMMADTDDKQIFSFYVGLLR